MEDSSQRRHKEVLKLLQIIFSAYWLMNLVGAIALWATGVFPFSAVSVILVFLVSNFSITEIIKRLDDKRSLQLERFRYWVVAPIIASVMVVVIPEPVAPFWYGFLTLCLGTGPMILRSPAGKIPHGISYGIYLVVWYTLTRFFIGDLGVPGEWVHQLVQACSILLVTISYSLTVSRLGGLLRVFGEREQHLNEIQEIAKVGDYRFEVRENNLYLSRGCSRILGYGEQEIEGQLELLLNSIHLDDSSMFEESFKQTIRLGTQSELQFRIVDAAGTTRYVRCVRHAERSSETGQVMVIKGIMQDMTETHLVYERAEELVERQRMIVVNSSRMSALGEMASGIAHEINNPLAIIGGKAQLVIRRIEGAKVDAPLDAVHAVQQLKTIDSMVVRIAAIIRGLRSFARDGQGDPFEQASVKVMIDDTIALCQSRFQNHDVRLDHFRLETDISIDCRAVQITQVLLNLLNNAYDAVKDLPEKWVKLSVSEEGDLIIFVVTDSGSGIPLEIRDNILKPFFTTKSVGQGTGLGLSIASGIAKDHSGLLEIDGSNPNTSFKLTLPKTQKPAHQPIKIGS